MIDTTRNGTLPERLALAACLVVAAVVAGWVAAFAAFDAVDVLRQSGLLALESRDVIARVLHSIAAQGFVILAAAAMARGAEELESGTTLARGARTAAATAAWVGVVAAIGYIVLTFSEGIGGSVTTTASSSVQVLLFPLAAVVVACGAVVGGVEDELDVEKEFEDEAELPGTALEGGDD